MDTNEGFSRIWEAFDQGELLPACAWCGRIRLDGAWVKPLPAALEAIDPRFTLSHSICEGCLYALAERNLSSNAEARRLKE